MKFHMSSIAFGLIAVTQLAWALPNAEVKYLQDEWAQAMYQEEGKQTEIHLAKLAEQSRVIAANKPRDAESLIWEGIILASYAGKVGGLSALGIVKEAKLALEQAIKLDPKALDGSAHTSLGSLYYQVPGWPLGFGDNKKAELYLKTGLELNPSGIDPNYFYGDFLFREGRLDEAETALQKALLAPARPGRDSADAGRRREVNNLLLKIKAAKS